MTVIYLVLINSLNQLNFVCNNSWHLANTCTAINCQQINTYALISWHQLNTSINSCYLFNRCTNTWQPLYISTIYFVDINIYFNYFSCWQQYIFQLFILFITIYVSAIKNSLFLLWQQLITVGNKLNSCNIYCCH